MVSPLKHYDAVLGMPCFHKKSVQLVYPESVFTFVHKGQLEQIVANSKGESIPVVNSTTVGKLVKSAIFAHMVFAKVNTVDSEAIINTMENKKLQF